VQLYGPPGKRFRGFAGSYPEYALTEHAKMAEIPIKSHDPDNRKTFVEDLNVT